MESDSPIPRGHAKYNCTCGLLQWRWSGNAWDGLRRCKACGSQELQLCTGEEAIEPIPTVVQQVKSAFNNRDRKSDEYPPEGDDYQDEGSRRRLDDGPRIAK